MPLDGLRAWIGEVERKLGMRTRIFLVLSVIAIGVGGAAIYLAIDARENSVSESDVQALRQQLETRIGEVGAAAATPPVEAEPEAEPEPEPEAAPAPKPEEQKPKPETGKSGKSGASNGASNGAASSAKIQELLQQAKERSEENK
jgi:hypothetical protein